MKKPSAVRVGPIEYDIQWVPDLLDDDESELYGVSYGTRQLVQINNSMVASAKRSTLFHEIMHLAFEGSGVDIDLELEESIVRSLETILLDTFQRRENRVVNKYLFGNHGRK